MYTWPLTSILYTIDMWFGLENMVVSYADDTTHLVSLPSLNTGSDVLEMLSRKLRKISSCIVLGYEAAT